MTWRLPWVSRELYTRACIERAAAHEAWVKFIEWLSADLVRADARYENLLAKYQTLKLQGANIPEPPRVIEPPKVDPVMVAVNRASAGKDAKVRIGMLKQVEIDRAAELTDAQIILRIHRGNRPADDVSSNPGEDRQAS